LCHRRPAFMRIRFDQALKQVIREVLTPEGIFDTETEVSPEPQRIDGYFVPHPTLSPSRSTLGLLGRMAARTCTFEPFHRTPDLDELSACIRKHLNFRHILSLRKPPPDLPKLWVISSGRPVTGLTGLGCHPDQDFPQGVYVAAPLFYIGVVVVNALPVTRDTLLLRLMGAGKVLQLPILLRLRLEVVESTEQRTSEEEEFLMSTQDIVDVWRRQALEEGVQKGLEKGIERGLALTRHAFVLMYEARFGPMPSSLHAAVDAVRDPEVLGQWCELAAHGAQKDVDRAIHEERSAVPAGVHKNGG